MKNFFKELKEFVSKGNAVDLAVGVVIGAAFDDVVKVLVKELVLPPISFFTQGINLENKSIILRKAGSIDGSIPIEDIAIGYGKIIEVSLNFIVIGLIVFLIIRSINVLKRKLVREENKVIVVRKDVELLEKTVDLLEKQNKLITKQLKEK